MEDSVRARIEREAEKHALVNAVKHDGEAQIGAVIGPLMAENPEFREFGDELPGVAGPVIDRVNDLGREMQRDRLADLAPGLLEEVEEPPGDDSGSVLPALPNADAYDEVRMRLAPNPNGPWHIGHARMPAVIGTYKAEYDGWFVCRFDDTDPETKRPSLPAYDWILEDIEYLGFEPDLIVRASDRLDLYYKHARELARAGGAYTCSCEAGVFSELKNTGRPCEHREKPMETVLEELDRLVAGEYGAGEMVLRVRTEIKHPNPALRDWVGLRIVETPHPRPEAAEYRCWPTLDFQSGIDDHLLGVTHIIRGIDLQDSARRQRYVYDALGWEYPEVLHWGRVEVDEYDVALSTSTIRDLVERGELAGWDDPAAPTLRSLRRRGIRGEAIVRSMVELGTSTSNVELSMASVYAHNRELIDDDADRLFLVRDGVAREVTGGPTVAGPPVHPDHDDRGIRELEVGGSVLVEPGDLPAHGDRVWLKGFGCVRHTRGAFEWTGDDISVVRDEGVPVVHWVPVESSRPVRLRTPAGDEVGRAESGVTAYGPGAVVQFERVAFARIDAQEPDCTVAYYAHP